MAIFALSLLSYGISGAAYAAVEPLSVLTEEFYGEGNIITISGFVKNFDVSDPQKRDGCYNCHHCTKWESCNSSSNITELGWKIILTHVYCWWYD